jgi:hypothetical protein
VRGGAGPTPPTAAGLLELGWRWSGWLRPDDRPAGRQRA